MPHNYLKSTFDPKACQRSHFSIALHPLRTQLRDSFCCPMKGVHPMRGIVPTLAAAVLLTLGAERGRAGLMLDVSGGQAFSLSGQTLGWQFKSTVPLQIEGLGMWDDRDHPLTGPHEIGLWTGGGVLLATTMVTAGSTPIPSADHGQWLFSFLSPVLLAPGTYVIGEYTNVGDKVLAGPTITTIPGVTFQGARVQSGPSLEFPTSGPHPGLPRYFGPDLLTAPEPGTITLLAVGVAGLLVHSWRRRTAAD
jgi:hypothetical protein